jgi:hypothetical protein
LFVSEILASPHPINKAAFLVEIPRHDLPHQLVWVAALLSGSLYQFRFLLGCEINFYYRFSV